MLHTPVLQKETIQYLNPKPGDWIVDSTLGLGGHSQLILQKIGPAGLLIGIDQDGENLKAAKERLKEFPNTIYVRDNFENLEEILRDVFQMKKEQKPIAGILFDLGVSSVHLDDPNRGFSFLREGPLDMRMDPRQKVTAAEIINKWPLKTLIHIFRTYGEERFSKLIAQAVCKRRKTILFTKTTELADAVAGVVRRKPGGIHPATRIFQALRIVVNHELEALEEGLSAAVRCAAPGARIVAISFHSLEDRIVKNIFRNHSKKENPPILSILTKKPVTPSEEEMNENPRSRSAKLRAAEKIYAPVSPLY